MPGWTLEHCISSEHKPLVLSIIIPELLRTDRDEATCPGSHTQNDNFKILPQATRTPESRLWTTQPHCLPLPLLWYHKLSIFVSLPDGGSCPMVVIVPGAGVRVWGGEWPRREVARQSQVLAIRGYSKLKLKTLHKFSSSFWFVSSRWNFFSHFVQTDGKRHWGSPPHLKTWDEKNCGSRDTGKWLIFGRVEVNRQATSFQQLFKFSPKEFSNLKNSHCFISGSE